MGKRPEPNVEGYPLHAATQPGRPRQPVLLVHASGHMLIANARAMELAGIDERTNPAGGEILRDAQGLPTGVLREAAMSPVYAAKSPRRSAEEERQSRAREGRRAGDGRMPATSVTSFQDAGSSLETIAALRNWPTRASSACGCGSWPATQDPRLAAGLGAARVIDAGDHHFTVRAIKRSIDGALGTHGAWLLEPYDDLPSSSGLNTASLPSLRQTAALALAHDLQLCIHAIGDRANREVLNIYQEAVQGAPA